MSAWTFVKERATTLILVALVTLVAGYEWHTARRAVNVAAAQVRAQPSQRGILAEGRLAVYPGSEVTVSAEIDGKLLDLRVGEEDRVAKGDLIAGLDVTDRSASLNEARARVSEAQADVDFLSNEKTRAETLLGHDVVPRAEFDKSVHDERAARARRVVLLAGVTQLQTTLAKSKVSAPISGTVTARFADPGEMLVAGAPIVTITDLSRVRVEAEVGEFDAGRVRLGAAVRVTAEGFDGSWRGEVEQIPDVVVTQRLRPLDPARPTDTRVLLVKVHLSEPTPLKVGQRVQVEIAR